MIRQLQPISGDMFYSPFSGALIKGQEEDGKWNVYIQASNEGLDQDSEVILCKALKDASDYYLTHGVLSWDHNHKLLNDPAFIIGEPEEVAFSDKNETLVKGFLYKENKIAQNLWDNILSGAKRLGASVGGGIIKKAVDHNQGVISRVVWDETAITHKPVNDGTFGKVSLLPFPEFVKALTAGSGVDAANFSGGRALVSESLQGSKVDIVPKAIPYEELRKTVDSIILAIRDGKIKSYTDMLNFISNQGYSAEQAGNLVQYISQKLPTIKF